MDMVLVVKNRELIVFSSEVHGILEWDIIKVFMPDGINQALVDKADPSVIKSSKLCTGGNGIRDSESCGPDDPHRPKDKNTNGNVVLCQGWLPTFDIPHSTLPSTASLVARIVKKYFL